MIEELKTFIAVVELNNFTKAGEKIGLSQPSVSLHIKNLEQYFETTLIKRSIKQKKIIITTQGKILYEKAKIIIDTLDETKEELSDYGNSIKGTLHIGCSFTLGEYFIPSFLGVFKEKYNDIDLHITIENTAHICEKVEKFELDLGLIEGTVNNNKFIYENIYEDNLVLAVGKNNPILNHTISKEYLEEQVWIGREKGSGSREQLDFFLLKNDIKPKNIIVLGSNYAIKETVKNNLGITFISSLVVNEDVEANQIHLIPMEEKYKRNFSYIYPNGSKFSKIEKIFIDMLKEYCKHKF